MARGKYRREEQASSIKQDVDSLGRLKDFNKHFAPQFDKNGKERDDWFYLYCKEHDFAIADGPSSAAYGKEAIHDGSTGNRKKGGLR